MSAARRSLPRAEWTASIALATCVFACSSTGSSPSRGDDAGAPDADVVPPSSARSDAATSSPKDAGRDGYAAASVCTMSTGAETKFSLVNRSKEALHVFWVHSPTTATPCVEEDYGVVGAGLMRDQPTYVGHAWAIRSEATGELRKELVVAGNETIEVE